MKYEHVVYHDWKYREDSLPRTLDWMLLGLIYVIDNIRVSSTEGDRAN